MKGVMRALEEVTRAMNLLYNFSVPKQNSFASRGPLPRPMACETDTLVCNQKATLLGAGTEKLSSQSARR